MSHTPPVEDWGEYEMGGELKEVVGESLGKDGKQAIYSLLASEAVEIETLALDENRPVEVLPLSKLKELLGVAE